MKIKNLVREVIHYLESNGLSTISDDVCDYIHDNYDWKSLGLTRNDIYYRTRWHISKMRSKGLTGCLCPSCK